ncbi:antibiotic biosynthesis monooxygenase family protein [Nocardioides sp.]|uniref:antibiotic biosynthesis monooxygenase family protein n=1 Tax=Nocardioides sp. TaxID=35761 RepID=UPI0039E5519A
MILEHALLPVAPGQESAFEAALASALPIIRRQPGCLSASVSRCVEEPSLYLLQAEWESLEAHDPGFRSSADYQEWKALLHHFYDPSPTVRHFAPITG